MTNSDHLTLNERAADAFKAALCLSADRILERPDAAEVLASFLRRDLAFILTSTELLALPVVDAEGALAAARSANGAVELGTGQYL